MQESEKQPIDLRSLLSADWRADGYTFSGKRGKSHPKGSPTTSSPSFKEISLNSTPMNPPKITKDGVHSSEAPLNIYANYTRLASIHRSIVSKTCHSQTVERNISFAAKLEPWFPVPLLIEVLIELHRTDLSEILDDEHALARILGHLECSLRIRCRTIPWRVIWILNLEFSMKLTKTLIFDYYLRAVSAGAFAYFQDWRSNRDTFAIMRGQIVALSLNLPVPPKKQREILQQAKELCTLLALQRVDPHDPEVYAHALVELAYKRITGKKALITTKNFALKTKLTFTIQSLHQDLDLRLSA